MISAALLLAELLGQEPPPAALGALKSDCKPDDVAGSHPSGGAEVPVPKTRKPKEAAGGVVVGSVESAGVVALAKAICRASDMLYGNRKLPRDMRSEIAVWIDEVMESLGRE